MRTLLIPFLIFSCGVMEENHHPTLTWLDERLPEADSSVKSIALGVALIPITVPAGAVDTFIANPVLQAPDGWETAKEIVWDDPSGSAFYQAAIFLPKVAITPVIFLGTWALHIMWVN
tara:strand:+ start:602 stop:955 length:354 start_codon:yes stop_codon:yes gene_type:complete